MPETSDKKKFFTKPLLIIFVTVMIDLIGFGIVIPVLPYYIEGFGATPLELGVLVASYSIMQFVFSPVLGGMSDRYGRRPVLFFSLLGTSVGFLVVGLAGALWMIFAGRILDGITGGNISTAQAYIADITTRKDRARGMGLIGAAFGLHNMIVVGKAYPLARQIRLMLVRPAPQRPRRKRGRNIPAVQPTGFAASVRRNNHSPPNCEIVE